MRGGYYVNVYGGELCIVESLLEFHAFIVIWCDLEVCKCGGDYYIASAVPKYGVIIMSVDSLTVKLSSESYGTTCI
jgi:hypothetical protein